MASPRTMAGILAGYKVPITVGASEAVGASGSTSVTLNGMDVGTAPGTNQRRYIIFAAFQRTGGTLASLTGCTIDGGAATTVGGPYTTAGGIRGWLRAKEIPTGTTISSTTTFSNGNGAMNFQYISFYTGPGGLTIGTPDSDIDDNNAVSLSLSCNPNGAIVAFKQDTNGGTMSWSGLTEQLDQDLDSGDYGSIAASSFGTRQTNLSVTGTITGSPASDLSFGVGLSPT